jgi:predicted aminopeptidase
MAARLPVLLAALLLGGCTTLGYYGHLARGQMRLLQLREPIDRILADPQRDPELQRRLKKVLAVRRWAVERLGLPDNRSYTSYADLGRPYVIWNVFAAPELSLDPVQNCFVIVGCMAYRGYYLREPAEGQAEILKARGYDVFVSGVPAYSTLNWFEDPVLSSMMRWSDEILIGTIIHELAHQQLYARNDTAFNESFAEFVEEQALEQYLAEQGGTTQAWRLYEQRRRQFIDLVLATRSRLEQVYRSERSDEEKRMAKVEQFLQLREEYQKLRDGPWIGYTGFDRWFEELEANNARLLPFGLYDSYKPAFGVLFKREGEDWPRFFAAAERLARLSSRERKRELKRLLDAVEG